MADDLDPQAFLAALEEQLERIDEITSLSALYALKDTIKNRVRLRDEILAMLDVCTFVLPPTPEEYQTKAGVDGDEIISPLRENMAARRSVASAVPADKREKFNNSKVTFLEEMTSFVEGSYGDQPLATEDVVATIIDDEEVFMNAVRMFEMNLFRDIKRNPLIFKGFWDPNDDDPVFDPQWSVTMLVYDFFLKFLMSSSLEEVEAVKHIKKDFVLQLMRLFDVEDPRERKSLRSILYLVYEKYDSHKETVFNAIQNLLLSYTFETDTHNGVPEILEVLSCIIFEGQEAEASGLRPEYVGLLRNVLVPLHKVVFYGSFHQQLTNCVLKILEVDDHYTKDVIVGLKRIWPNSNATKQVLFLEVISDLVGQVDSAEVWADIYQPLYRIYARCISSEHFHVSSSALQMLRSGRLNAYMESYQDDIFPIIFEAVLKASKHWNAQVAQIGETLLDWMKDKNPSLCSTLEERIVREQAKRAQRDKLEKERRRAETTAPAKTLAQQRKNSLMMNKRLAREYNERGGGQTSKSMSRKVSTGQLAVSRGDDDDDDDDADLDNIADADVVSETASEASDMDEPVGADISAASQAEIDRLNERVRELEGLYKDSKLEAQQLKKKIEHVNEENKHQKREITTLSKRARDAEKRERQKVEENAEVKEKLRKVNDQLERLDFQLSTLDRKDKKKRKDEIKAMVEADFDAGHDDEDAKKGWFGNRSKKKLDALRLEYSRLLERLSSAEQRTREAESRVNELETEIKAKSEHEEFLRSSVTSLREKVAAHWEELTRTERKLREAQEKVERKDEEIMNTRQQIDEMRKAGGGRVYDGDARRRIETLEERLSKKTAEVEDLHETLEGKEDSIDTQKEEITSLRTEIKKRDMMIQGLKDLAAQLKDRIDKLKGRRGESDSESKHRRSRERRKSEREIKTLKKTKSHDNIVNGELKEETPQQRRLKKVKSHEGVMNVSSLKASFSNEI